jgi:hypothetical protein
MALDNFFAKMDQDMAEWNKFLNRVWNKKAKMPSFYLEKILEVKAARYTSKVLVLFAAKVGFCLLVSWGSSSLAMQWTKIL